MWVRSRILVHGSSTQPVATSDSKEERLRLLYNILDIMIWWPGPHVEDISCIGLFARVKGLNGRDIEFRIEIDENEGLVV